MWAALIPVAIGLIQTMVAADKQKKLERESNNIQFKQTAEMKQAQMRAEAEPAVPEAVKAEFRARQAGDSARTYRLISQRFGNNMAAHAHAAINANLTSENNKFAAFQGYKEQEKQKHLEMFAQGAQAISQMNTQAQLQQNAASQQAQGQAIQSGIVNAAQGAMTYGVLKSQADKPLTTIPIDPNANPSADANLGIHPDMVKAYASAKQQSLYGAPNPYGQQFDNGTNMWGKTGFNYTYPVWQPRQYTGVTNQ